MKKIILLLFVCATAFGASFDRVQIPVFKGNQARVINNILGQIESSFETNVFDTIQMNIDFEDGVEEGRLQWNPDDGVLEYGMPGGNVTLQVGLENLMRSSNKSGADISNGVPIYVSGAQGGRPKIALADADGSNSYHVCGLATETIDNNGNGYVATFGYVRDIDTSAWAAGDTLYLSTEAGTLTNGIPAYPAEPVCVGIVLVSNAESGVVLVNPRSAITFDLLETTPLKVYTIEYTSTNIYNDLRFPFSSVDLPGLGADPDVAIVNGCIYTLTFAQNDYLFFNPQMSHDYWPNTPLFPHLHTYSTGTAITNTFKLIYSYADIGGVFTAQKTNTVTIATSGVAGEHELHNLGAMDALSVADDDSVSSMIGVKLIRTDSGTGINMMEFDIHYRIKYGGGQEYP